jgi:hypothetical protein
MMTSVVATTLWPLRFDEKSHEAKLQRRIPSPHPPGPNPKPREHSMSDPGPWTPPERRSDNSGSDDAQRIFDTVTGPNLRVSDNLIQLAAICGGALVCAIIGAVWAWMTNNHPMAGVLVGGFAGVLISLFLSGAILGLVRFMSAVKSR